MAPKKSEKKANIKALFSNTRTRVIILFTLALITITIAVGFYKFHTSTSAGPTSDVNRPPSIRSIPGKLDQTAQYAALQEQQNVEQARLASAKGTSAIPTIISTQQFGEGVESVGASGGEGSVGFGTLQRNNLAGPQSSIWLQALKKSNCDKESIDMALSQGASIEDLKAGCSCFQLKQNGYGIADLKAICSCDELKRANFTIKQMQLAGFSALQLKQCGFVACEEKSAGFSAEAMKQAGYSDGELKGAGFTDSEIAKAGGLPDSITAEDVHKAGCGIEELKRLRLAGVTAAAIKRISGCPADALKAAGFTATDLNQAGFSAAELKHTGFTPKELRQAGYKARALLNAGFSPTEVSSAGFSPDEINAAESILPPSITAKDVTDAGCSQEALTRERLAGVSAKLIKKHANCDEAALKAAGFDSNELLNAGFTPKELATTDGSGVDDNAVRMADCSIEKLKELKAQNVSAKRIHALNGCSASALKQSGFDLPALSDAGFTTKDLLAGGFLPENLASEGLGITDSDIKSAGCDPTQLKNLLAKGVSAKKIHDLNGCDANKLKSAGFGLKALADAGFSPDSMLQAGFSPKDLVAAGLGITPAGVIASGRKMDCSPQSLKSARELGLSATTVKKTLGCSSLDLKNAGFSAEELKEAGFSAAELKNAGFDAAALKNAGFGAKDLMAAGFNADALKAAGFNAQALKEAGFSARALKDAGFGIDALKAAGFDANVLKEAGFSLDNLRKAGFGAKELKEAGFGATELKNAGFTSEALQSAGFSSDESALAGLNALNTPATPSSNLATIPSISGLTQTKAQVLAAQEAENAKKLKLILDKQQVQMADQKFQQKIQQRSAQMLTAANQVLQGWKQVTPQKVEVTTVKEDKLNNAVLVANEKGTLVGDKALEAEVLKAGGTVIKTGDIIFAVIDTAVNSDEASPILATVVSGKLTGSKLIGTFNLPANADKMVISFNTLSVPGAPKTIPISAFAVDPNTARTALSSQTDHHYLMRYGSLFASTFLEGFGNAFQSANTTVTIGGTGGVQDTTVTSGVGRSALENAVIGLATLGKAWGQVAQQNMARPTTVEVFSGTAIGVLFTQDITVI